MPIISTYKYLNVKQMPQRSYSTFSTRIRKATADINNITDFLKAVIKLLQTLYKIAGWIAAAIWIIYKWTN